MGQSPRRAGRPVVGWFVFALLVILIGALIAAISAAQRDDASSKHARPTGSVATRPPTSRPRIAFPVQPPATSPGQSRLLALTIAAPSHQDSYERAVDFGGFTDDDGCKNTRAEVLIRTSAVAVTFTTARECTVKTGRWTDPWSGVTTTLAHDLEIDHTVPLANAWQSGAWAWTAEQRVAYANDLTDLDHLVPILSAENESKGDDGPEAWRPPNRTAWCTYARVWDHIKAKWHLSATQEEWNEIVAMAATC